MKALRRCYGECTFEMARVNGSKKFTVKQPAVDYETVAGPGQTRYALGTKVHLPYQVCRHCTLADVGSLASS